MKNAKVIALEEAKSEISAIINDLNSTTACFTGHRSQKLPWKFNEDDERCIAMKAILRQEIEKAILKGYRTFISGMAIGFDMICAETVLEFKRQYEDIKLIGALPYKTQDIKWSVKDRERYRGLLARLDDVRCLYDEYKGKDGYIERNKYMVNNSSLVIALYGGIYGGTSYTLKYAREQGLEIVIIKP